jgi:hypothetical protein
MALKLRFDAAEVQGLARRYCEGDARRKTNDSHLREMVPLIQGRGYLNLDDLRTVGKWKAPRAVPKLEGNMPGFVREVTGLSLGAASEQLRVEILRLLAGVEWPTASVILHWFHADPYPILDFRALASVGADPGQPYGFAFWHEYTEFCRSLAQSLRVSMRTLDRALWQHSWERDREARRRRETN